MPMLWRTCEASRSISYPLTNARPLVGWSKVHNILIVVLFPAPLGPRKPKVSPRSTWRSIPFTACISPKERESFSIVMVMVLPQQDGAGLVGLHADEQILPHRAGPGDVASWHGGTDHKELPHAAHVQSAKPRLLASPVHHVHVRQIPA